MGKPAPRKSRNFPTEGFSVAEPKAQSGLLPRFRRAALAYPSLDL
jgi:hypothetical protein